MISSLCNQKRSTVVSIHQNFSDHGVRDEVTIEALDQAFAEKARDAVAKPPLSRIDKKSLRQIVYRNYLALDALVQEKNFDYSDLAALLKEHYKLNQCSPSSVRKYMGEARTSITHSSHSITEQLQQSDKPESNTTKHGAARDPRKSVTNGDSQAAIRQEFKN